MNRKLFGLWLPGMLVMLIGMALTAVLTLMQYDASLDTARMRLAQSARASTDAISQRLTVYAEIVSGVRDLFSVDPDLQRADFERIVSFHNARNGYPELRNLSFVRWVRAAGLEEFLSQAREQYGLAEHAPFIHPFGPRDDYYVVEYLWPEYGNEGIIGLDIATQDSNIAAFYAARDSRHVVVSAPFALAQEEQEHMAFVVRAPVYVANYGYEAGKFIGAVGSIIDVQGMLAAIAKSGMLQDVAISIHDLGTVADGHAAQGVVLGQYPHAEQPGLAQAELGETHLLQVPGRLWRLHFTPRGSMLSASERMLPVWVAAMGLIFTLMLTALVALLARQKGLALYSAQTSAAAMRDTEERFKAIFNQAAVGVALTDIASGALIRINKKYADILGYEVDELLHKSFQGLTHPDDLQADLDNLQRMNSGEIQEFVMQKRMLRKGGEPVWVSLTVAPILRPDEATVHHVAVIHDISAQRALQETLRHNEQQLLDILDHLPLGVLLIGRQEEIVFRNQRFLDVFGFTRFDVASLNDFWLISCPDSQRREQAIELWQRLCRQASQESGLIAAQEFAITDISGQPHTVEIAGALVNDGYLMLFDDLSEHRQAQEQINYLAYFDTLTQLPNRRQLRDKLEQAMADSEQAQTWGAILLLDIDHFKVLNESRGHASGDQLLRQVAERLSAFAHDGQVVARHGDDEFVLIMKNLSSSQPLAKDLAQDGAEQIMELIRAPYWLAEMPYYAAVSIGLALFSGAETSAEELLKHADLAMYQAKAAGRNTMRFYHPDDQHAVSERAALELDLRVALELGQFELFYQAQICSNKVFGAEALLRWHHPEKSFVSPAIFIPLAEENGLILPIGAWVLDSACKQLALWAKDPVLGELTLSVNVSPRQFHQADFVEQVLRAVQANGAPAKNLVLELTEGMLLQDIEQTVARMNELKSYGVGFSLDDFGTGYSSLSYLKRLPLDELKIDQSFVRDLLTDASDAAIVRAIIALGASMGLRVVAEGVETTAQKECLQAQNCNAWQGYLFGRPVKDTDFISLVQNHQIF